ncbi:MAG: ester cyclase [Thaumarchaeota archaeon]|nr:ester cyclase [Nitrososphaerota archaeon]MBI3641729.1 ester cyclase [Nitrososphaerota archaeon]
MTIEDQNLETVKHFEDEFKNKQNRDIVDELFSSDFVHHIPFPGLAPGRDGAKQVGKGIHSAFPDVHVTTEQIFAKDDKVVVRSFAQATHKGEFWGVLPTGKKVSWTENHIYRLKDGKIAEHWVELNYLGLLMQLGVLTTPK